ncbi:growth factor receptor-bound protein 2-like [Pecten maximus]|uniref:growth factor receptor-bound protein 2-like n=1 Tax=Pecten maximus TaxID=6579 RepID=UPI0014585110|nr:growth factor receptor-bound protein 2-like [Pecten maximus]XP_033734742.1 growth factor receptor-bound protein 2-like [Pecten maximus]XP_033734751.1 growth factor receptor-bound protein 2-like [Pecten maximus]XP_033734761.1 growth factor receptor-bound protein 2-like [Pecten maximus]XP_033734770.1 growth factor receptor-bound protein 2-like [Pecten maximus]XP_033734778.1 growth factor receptor-bound protein 2-like [Pecten maximus]XP_033734786.1 growth factor receptor-bound protein 2-like 
MEARALHDFKPTKDDELAFEKGDRLCIMDTHCDENWWSAVRIKNPEQGKGYVPKTYIKMEPNDWYAGRISREQAVSLLLRGNQPDGSFLLRDSESSPGDYSLSVRFQGAVQHFKILRDGSGKFFLWVKKFPSINSLIEHHQLSSVSRTETILLRGKPKEGAHEQKLEQVTCMYDFKPDDDEELPFSKGDIIEVLEKEIDSWWRGKNMRTGETGLFPINYVKQK